MNSFDYLALQYKTQLMYSTLNAAILMSVVSCIRADNMQYILRVCDLQAMLRWVEQQVDLVLTSVLIGQWTGIGRQRTARLAVLALYIQVDSHGLTCFGMWILVVFTWYTKSPSTAPLKTTMASDVIKTVSPPLIDEYLLEIRLKFLFPIC